MSRDDKLMMKILTGRQDRNISFAELQKVLQIVGFILDHVTGDHHIYIKEGIPEIINLQPTKNGNAKPYQVKQVRALITKYGLGGD